MCSRKQDFVSEILSLKHVMPIRDVTTTSSPPPPFRSHTYTHLWYSVLLSWR
uniref:Uncharacterized protein n=1 Tax=Anguilla anguilla TaxID=7936 RepID=A0A0E9X4L6_ANGAN